MYPYHGPVFAVILKRTCLLELMGNTLIGDNVPVRMGKN